MDSGTEQSRRRYLSIASLLVTGGVAGCNSSESEADGENESTTVKTETDPQELDPASFTVTDVEAPATLDIDEGSTIDFTVRNTGERTGAFEGVLEIRRPSSEVWEPLNSAFSPRVAPGEHCEGATYFDGFTKTGQYEARIGEATWSFEVTDVKIIESQVLTGSGDAVRDDISIENPLVIVSVDHEGSSFEVTLRGDYSDPVTVTGESSAAQATLDYRGAIDRDTYELDVTADGEWEIELWQPTDFEGVSLPVSRSGEGQDVLGPIAFDGKADVRVTHKNGSSLEAQMYWNDPRRFGGAGILLSKKGEFEIEDQLYSNDPQFIEIDSDGEWTFEFRDAA